jgi:hypothetical protein
VPAPPALACAHGGTVRLSRTVARGQLALRHDVRGSWRRWADDDEPREPSIVIPFPR